jgi:8-oxo-dGTP pyrophosphatase MutT (NUDIX family)
MADTPAPVAEPRPAASVILVRDAVADAPEPIEIYMIRRKRGMKFLGGFYAFPGGKVDAADAGAAVLARCHGLGAAEAAACFAAPDGVPPLAFWVAALRELLEESGVLLACDERGASVPYQTPEVMARAEAARAALVAGGADFGALLTDAGWRPDVGKLRYFSHFVTPRTSPIRFSARFFLCRLPEGQEPRLFTEETSEGFWIHPGEGHRRFLAREMAMAEPAEYGLAYIAQFASVDELWQACADNREKLAGLIDRIEFRMWQDFDWAAGRWQSPPPPK